jgi:hypothetical protein
MKGFTLENEMAGFDFTACSRDETLEVVSKSQIRFKGPAKRDYMSDLSILMYASRRQADRESAAYMGM